MTKGRRVAKPVRQRLILAEARTAASVRVAPLAARLGVSTETIRRDLRELHDGGAIERIYGGATAASSQGRPDAESSRHAEEWRRLAVAAVQGLQDGHVVMLGGGAVAQEVARHLVTLSIDLCVITNSTKIAAAASADPRIETLLCPGRYISPAADVIGEDTIFYLQQFNADLAIVEPLALSADGPFEENSMTAAVKRVMLQRAERRILVAGTQAWPRSAARGICPLDLIDEVIVSRRPAHELSKAFARAGVRVSTARPLRQPDRSPQGKPASASW